MKPENSIGFSGTRRGMNEAQKKMLEKRLLALRRKGFTWFHHGDCVGADAEAHDIAKRLGYKVAIHPPENPMFRALKKGDWVYLPAPYLDRNRGIVNCTALLLAAPDKPEDADPRSGTWYTARYAASVDKPFTILMKKPATH